MGRSSQARYPNVPSYEVKLFGITNQMRRAAVSVTSNIAEGFSRNSYKEKVQFYSVAPRVH